VNQYFPKMITGPLRHEIVKQVAAGYEFTALLTDEGTVWTCGRNNSGQLGIGDKEPRSIPTPVVIPSSKPVKMIACGDAHMLALTADGKVYSWGWANFGQLGHVLPEETQTNDDVMRALDSYVRPIILPMARLVDRLVGHKVVSIACGDTSSFAVTEDGQLFSWGTLSQEQTFPSYTPGLVQFFEELRLSPLKAGIETVVCGGGSTFVIVRVPK